MRSPLSAVNLPDSFICLAILHLFQSDPYPHLNYEGREKSDINSGIHPIGTKSR